MGSILYPISHRLCGAGQDLLDQVGHRNFAAHETDAVFFRLLGHAKALHAGGGQCAAQRFVFPFAHVDTSIGCILHVYSVSYFHIFEKWVLLGGFPTHTPTHNRKKWGGKERVQEQVCAKIPQRKAQERAGKQWLESLDTLRNQQASGSSPLSSSKKIHALAAWIFAYLKGAKIHEQTRVRIPEKRPCFHPHGGL